MVKDWITINEAAILLGKSQRQTRRIVARLKETNTTAVKNMTDADGRMKTHIQSNILLIKNNGTSETSDAPKAVVTTEEVEIKFNFQKASSLLINPKKVKEVLAEEKALSKVFLDATSMKEIEEKLIASSEEPLPHAEVEDVHKTQEIKPQNVPIESTTASVSVEENIWRELIKYLTDQKEFLKHQVGIKDGQLNKQQSTIENLSAYARESQHLKATQEEKLQGLTDKVLFLEENMNRLIQQVGEHKQQQVQSNENIDQFSQKISQLERQLAIEKSETTRQKGLYIQKIKEMEMQLRGEEALANYDQIGNLEDKIEELETVVQLKNTEAAFFFHQLNKHAADIRNMLNKIGQLEEDVNQKSNTLTEKSTFITDLQEANKGLGAYVQALEQKIKYLNSKDKG